LSFIKSSSSTLDRYQTKDSKNCSQAEIVEIIKPSPARREALCQHYQRCGGCQYQHMEYAVQLKEKSSQIHQLLNHIAGITTEVKPTIASPQEFTSFQKTIQWKNLRHWLRF